MADLGLVGEEHAHAERAIVKKRDTQAREVTRKLGHVRLKLSKRCNSHEATL
jgi:hypothetical protein